ncbi:MAG: hypothetical protein ACTSRW_13105 [Candidatus Helarchaeota archaeon]
MPESKRITLNITETEETVLSGKGKIDSIEIKGELLTVNPSSSQRIWNLVHFFEGSQSTSLTLMENKIGSLEPEAKNEVTYVVQEKDVTYRPLIELTETVDTYFEKGDDINWNFVLDSRMPTKFILTLKNASNQPTTKVTLKKKLLDFFDNPIIESTTSGNASFDESSRLISWEDITIPPGEEQSLVFRAGANPTETTPYPTGEIDVNYEIQKVQRSKLNPTIIGVSESIFALEKDEAAEDEWDCTVEFQNTSDFDVKLNTVKVIHVKEGVKEVTLEENPYIELASNEVWSKSFKVTSHSPPKFSKTNDFSVLSVLNTRVVGHIHKKSDDIPVAAIESQKVLEPQEVPAHAKTDIKVTDTIKNVGSAPLTKIMVIDVIPSSFKPPSLDQVVIQLAGNSLGKGPLLQLEPDNDNPDLEHRLTIDIPNITQFGTPLNPGDEIVISYPLKAWEPRPAQYGCPLEANFNVTPPGQPVKNSLPDVKITARQVRRKYRAFKQVRPGSEPDMYEINVVFQNKGEVPVEKCKVTDLIPKGFVLKSWTPEEKKPEIIDVEDGTSLVWELSDISAGGQETLAYTIKGEGDYVEEDPEIEFL